MLISGPSQRGPFSTSFSVPCPAGLQEEASSNVISKKNAPRMGSQAGAAPREHSSHLAKGFPGSPSHFAEHLPTFPHLAPSAQLRLGPTQGWGLAILQEKLLVWGEEE